VFKDTVEISGVLYVDVGVEHGRSGVLYVDVGVEHGRSGVLYV